MFIYAAASPIVPLGCTAYVCVDADGVTGLDLRVTTNGAPSGSYNDPQSFGHVNVDGLYYVGPLSATLGDLTYGATLGLGGPEVGSLTLTWVPSIAPSPCLTWPAAPAPVLTATPLYNPTPGLNNVQLDWTASVSADSRFWSIEYDIYKDIDLAGLAFLGFVRNTLTYTDVGVPVGHTIRYRVRGFEPVIGGGDYSNTVALIMGEEVPVTTSRGSWGVLAR